MADHLGPAVDRCVEIAAQRPGEVEHDAAAVRQAGLHADDVAERALHLGERHLGAGVTVVGPQALRRGDVALVHPRKFLQIKHHIPRAQHRRYGCGLVEDHPRMDGPRPLGSPSLSALRGQAAIMAATALGVLVGLRAGRQQEPAERPAAPETQTSHEPAELPVTTITERERSLAAAREVKPRLSALTLAGAGLPASGLSAVIPPGSLLPISIMPGSRNASKPADSNGDSAGVLRAAHAGNRS